ncbi:CASP-like protein 5C1 [Bidens hawaiensis]|uniref:CASP-like protein 5C1 n=1 Tax=Bidens hawaiensis TaxID=980011 RepID=UPI00404ACE55
MNELSGSTGTSAGFALRLGQIIFSSASLLFMSFGVQFYSYTSFCFLVTIMGLVIPWSFALALLDGYSVIVTCPIRQKGILFIIVIGDWVNCYPHWHSGACSAASVVEVMLTSGGSVCRPKICSRYLISTVFAFLSWFLSMVSSLFNLLILPNL